MAELDLDADIDGRFVSPLRVAGNTVLVTAELGRRRAHDDEQLMFAAEHGLILITHNVKDYLLLQRAWRHWPDVWGVEPRPLHAGILAVPQVSEEHIVFMADVIDQFIRSGAVLANRFYEWQWGREWVQQG
jgi:hypothetical protein